MNPRDPKISKALEIAREAALREEMWREAMLELLGAVPKGLAGEAYEKKPNPKKLAALLLAGLVPPTHILKAIGRALMPGKERGHLKLGIKAPPKSKSRAELISDFVARLRAKEIVEEARKAHKEKEAIGIAATKLKKKDSWIRETIRMNDEELWQPLVTGKRPRVQKRQLRSNVGKANVAE